MGEVDARAALPPWGSLMLRAACRGGRRAACGCTSLSRMRTYERLGLAREAYARAIALARAVSTPTSWGRVLTAARNLDAARRDQDRERSRNGSRSLPGPVPGVKPVGPELRDGLLQSEPSPPLAHPPGRARTGEPVIARHTPVLRPAFGPALRADLSKVWERSRALKEESRRLVEQARSLRAEIEELVASCPSPLSTRRRCAGGADHAGA